MDSRQWSSGRVRSSIFELGHPNAVGTDAPSHPKRDTADPPSMRPRPSVDAATSPSKRHDQRSSSAAPSPLPSRFCVVVGPAAFRASWLAILLFHAACLAFCVGAAFIYAQLPSTMLAYLITAKSLAIGIEHFPLVSNAYAAIAAGHTFFIASMLAASVASRQLAFFWWPQGATASSAEPKHAQFRSIRSITPTAEPAAELAALCAAATVPTGSTLATPPLGSMPRTARSMLRRLPVARARAVASALFGRTGLFGVNGRHFERIMLVRELVEASLQAMQAHELARLLPRLALVRAYVAMLVVNCWSTLALHRLVAADLPLQRLLCLVSDLALDFASVIGVWSALAYRYVYQYDPAQRTFPIALLTDDFWYVHFINDFRLVLISSWVDLAAQLAFFMSMFGAINDVKLLLHRRAGASLERPRRRNGVDPHHAIRSNLDASASRELDARIQSAVKVQRCGRAFTRLLHAAIALLGAAVLATHAFAETRPSVPSCRLEVLSWFRARSGCALLEIDCYRAGMGGSQLEIAAEVRKVAADSLEHLALVHCPSLRVPPALQELHQLCVLKIYNSTVEHWGADAALTRTHHPDLGTLIMARVNTTDRQLPAGLMSPDFPPSLVSIQLSVLNVEALPMAVASLWPRQLSLFWESSGLTAVPETLEHMPLQYFSLADNAIAALPPALAFMPGRAVVNLGGNPFSELAPGAASGADAAAVPFAGVLILDITSTLVATLPDAMITALLASRGQVVYAGSTPLCASIQAGGAAVDGRLVDLHARGVISCAGGGEAHIFPLEEMTARYAIHDGPTQ